MTILLGMDNATAHRMLKASGQLMQLIQSTAPVIDPVTGGVVPGIPISTELYGLPLPASATVVAYYGFTNIQEKDALFFIEAIVEPSESMKLIVNGDTYTIIKSQSITKNGLAKLFVVQVRK